MRRTAGSGTRVDTALLAVCVLLALILKAAGDPVREGFASFMRRTVLAPAFSMQASVEKWRSALASHDALVASRDSALLRAMDVPALKAENKRMEGLLVLAGRVEWGFIPARVLHELTRGRQTTVTLAAGADAGIVVDSPVIAADGLVGVVQSVEKHLSIVSLWTHPNFATSAMSDDGQAYGIVKPYLSAGGGSGHLLILENVQRRHVLAPGTRIVTSGMGGIWPAMTPIGTIIDTIGTESSLARTYIVRPAVKPQDISTVIVLTPARAKAGIKGVWLTPAQRDSATRVAAAKGDSIARVQRQAEIKALTDSSLANMRRQPPVRDTIGVPPPVENNDTGARQ